MPPGLNTWTLRHANDKQSSNGREEENAAIHGIVDQYIEDAVFEGAVDLFDGCSESGMARRQGRLVPPPYVAKYGEENLPALSTAWDAFLEY